MIRELPKNYDSFSDVVELLTQLESAEGLGWMFRGQARAEWQLLPKAGRKPIAREAARKPPTDSTKAPPTRADSGPSAQTGPSAPSAKGVDAKQCR